MLDSFLTFINQQGLAPGQETYLLAVSGGVDSVVLAHLFHKMGWKAALAHCNFGLRGEESDDDEEFVRELAATYGFNFHSKTFDTKRFAKEQVVSTQMAARELRYSWFEEIRKVNGYDKIATAHHANDSFETVLLNLTRGTGLSGLRGIAVKHHFLVRPLLFASKEEILVYATSNALTWREDRSNNTDDYKRNLIRHKAMPVFQTLNPSLTNTFNTTSKRITAASNLLDAFLRNWKATVVTLKQGTTHIAVAELLASDEPVYRLWYLLDEFGFSYQQAEQIIAAIPGIPGRKFASGSYVLLIDRADLIVTKKLNSSEDPHLKIDKADGYFKFGDMTLHFQHREGDSNPRTCFDKDSLIVESEKLFFPLSVRKWEAGDFFMPFGMKGKKKKLSDLFIDLKIDRFQKENISVLLNGNDEIIWVIGIRSDERYRVGDSAGEIVFISISNKI